LPKICLYALILSKHPFVKKLPIILHDPCVWQYMPILRIKDDMNVVQILQLVNHGVMKPLVPWEERSPKHKVSFMVFCSVFQPFWRSL